MTTPPARHYQSDIIGPDATPFGPEMVFTQTGALTVMETTELRPRSTITAVGLAATLVTAGSGTTTIKLYKNGAVVGDQLDIPAGETYAFIEFTLPVRFRARSDSYKVGITTVGAGAAGLGGAVELAA